LKTIKGFYGCIDKILGYTRIDKNTLLKIMHKKLDIYIPYFALNSLKTNYFAIISL